MQRPHYLLPLTAAAMLAPGSAAAQAQVTISGAMDLSAESVNTGDPNGRLRQLASGTLTSSRIVFAGREDLGGGLQASFKLDMGIQADTGNLLPAANANFGRTSIVAIEDRQWGQVALGRAPTPLTPMLVQTDFARAGFYGNDSSVSQNIVGRVSNGIFYTSPNVGGLLVRAVYAFGESSAAPSDQGNFYGVGIQYERGPLLINGAFQSTRQRTSTGTNLAEDNGTEAGLGGRYDFGGVVLNAGWYKIHQVTPAAARDAAIPSDNTTSYWLGAVFKVGDLVDLGLQVGQTKGDLVSGAFPKPSGTTYATFASYKLSKRTSLYVNAAKVNNNGGSKLSLIPAAYYARIRPTLYGSDPSAFALGIVHYF